MLWVQPGSDGEAHVHRRKEMADTTIIALIDSLNDLASSQGTISDRREPNYPEVTAQAKGGFLKVRLPSKYPAWR